MLANKIPNLSIVTIIDILKQTTLITERITKQNEITSRRNDLISHNFELVMTCHMYIFNPSIMFFLVSHVVHDYWEKNYR